MTPICGSTGANSTVQSEIFESISVARLANLVVLEPVALSVTEILRPLLGHVAPSTRTSDFHEQLKIRHVPVPSIGPGCPRMQQVSLLAYENSLFMVRKSLVRP